MPANSDHNDYHQLSPLNPLLSHSLWYGDFGIIRWVYKPHNIASTLWNHISLLDLLVHHYSHHPIIKRAIETFGIDHELWMLTRLDHNTAGMVRFARDYSTKELWLKAQDQWAINKIYEADVTGWIQEKTIINLPIMHHRYDDRKMIIVSKDTAINGRWRIHQVSTTIYPLEIFWNNTHIRAVIHQWCRHQIRIHCHAHWIPIVWETLYHKSRWWDILHLRSVGIERGQLEKIILINYHEYNSSFS